MPRLLRLNKNIIRLSVIFSMFMSCAASADERRIFDHQSPSYLLAIGKLTIPSERQIRLEPQHFIEQCSATLLDDRYKQRRWLLSAWHCIEHYHNLGKRIIFQIADTSGIWHEREAHIVIHGGSIKNDWVLLRTETSLPGTVLSLGLADYNGGAVTLAGYSGDKGLGRGGEVLTYQEQCYPSHTMLDETQTSINCWAFKGASGGAIIQQGRLVGVVSQGDNAGTASFVDHARYADHINRALP